MFIDTHLHLSKSDYEDIDNVVKSAYLSNVKYLIVSCCTFDSITEGLSLSKKYSNIFLSIGLHPSEANNYSIEELNEIERLASDKSNKIVAIGEIGLDYHYGKEDCLEQKELFIKQLEIANRLNLPVVIHTRDAIEDTLAILKRNNSKGVIHCFSGSLEIAKEYIKRGYKLGIGGVITFKNSKLYSIIKYIGVENIVLETDSPYLAPDPYRGQKNEPKYIPIIAKKVAESLGCDIKIIEEKTSKNATTIFDLK